MTDSFVTQCPHCQTRFRINHQQLSVARGVVRCGQCLQVFNAARQLLEQSQAAAVPPMAEPPESSPLTAATDQPPVVPTAPAAEHDWAADFDALDLDQALASLERRDPQGERPRPHGDDSLQARRDDPRGELHGDEAFGTANDERTMPQAEPTTAPVLLETAPSELDTTPDERLEPSLGTHLALDDDLDPVVRRNGLQADDEQSDAWHPANDPAVVGSGMSALDDDDAAVRLSARDDDPVEPLDGRDGEGRLEPMLAARPPRVRKEPLVDVVDDPLQLEWHKPAPNWRKRLLWGALALLAAGLLAFQYLYYHFDEMVRHDRYRPLFQQLCPTLGCQVPTRVDVARIKSSNLVVRSHPDFKGALIVDAIIYNRAPFSQPFPLLELRFADLNGQLIASRRFKPSEYLSGELAGRGEMPSQTPIHIALDILDPGPKAVNYSLSFRSPE
ncbi:zinc-ribbon domain-containing protein [Pseudomonas sp. S75]|uniref:DUF3426 domain-containing protein n=1 Tax=unclassified Pseudomonas TaxID=196821 RepID=UPI0019042287|nr:MULTISPECIES: DUF3426 domain-containing protein [unclassified Pseudomonas]MBJ9974728.1 zinc-ribbon domain-containing protein [Pseudomonas sp. S30]MBK0152516.1 zinc-ribbon domain-containing protein [Pseudomonas sp. S75]